MPSLALKGKKVDKGLTNVGNVESPHWRWLGTANRSVVPFTSFSELGRTPEGRFEAIWFALEEQRPLTCIAGIWTTWTSTRKLREGEVTVDLLAFLTTAANGKKSIPRPCRLLTNRSDVDTWLSAMNGCRAPPASAAGRQSPAGRARDEG